MRMLLIATVCKSFKCPYAYTPLNGETTCSTTTFCQAAGGSGYECMNGQCCRINGLCNVDEVSVGYQCLKIAYEKGSCVNTVQCQPSGALSCVNGICSRVHEDNGVTCSKAGQIIERRNGALLNCLYKECSTGFGCEYNKYINQYICCGMQKGQNEILKDSRPSLPVKCYGSSDCLSADTPNCVNSQKYGYFVCCSTFNC